MRSSVTDPPGFSMSIGYRFIVYCVQLVQLVACEMVRLSDFAVVVGLFRWVAVSFIKIREEADPFSMDLGSMRKGDLAKVLEVRSSTR